MAQVLLGGGAIGEFYREIGKLTDRFLVEKKLSVADATAVLGAMHEALNAQLRIGIQGLDRSQIAIANGPLPEPPGNGRLKLD